MKFIFKLFLIPLLSLCFFSYSTVQANSAKEILFFWAEGCPHCHEEKIFLDEYLKDKENIKIKDYEVSKSKENLEKMNEVARSLNADVRGVPFTVFEDKYVTGFLRGTTEQKIIDMIGGQFKKSDSGICTVEEPCEDDAKSSIKFNLPILGAVDSASLSLPTLSILIGFVDGFNPCAMWVLIFLISALLGMQDRRRMWLLGSVFILASGMVYFMFMAAWLNFFLFIGMVTAVRIIIGLLALGVGSYNLKEYFTKKESVCKVTGADKRKKTFEKIKEIIHKKSIIIALVGIVILAFAVNLVELICSAGLPAIFTQILSLSDLPIWKYYAYIFLYILFFMIDDLVIFVIAMKTLQLTGLTTKYTRVTKLIGGIIMLILGILLVIKPEWLMFG